MTKIFCDFCERTAVDRIVCFIRSKNSYLLNNDVCSSCVEKFKKFIDSFKESK